VDLHIASKTDRGRLREINEDSLLTDLPLVAVADGMGGHVAGEVASKLAVEVLGSWKDRLGERSDKELAQSMKDAFREVNSAVFQKGSSDENLHGMGTTLTAAWIENGTATLAHVGDSRAYLLRAGELQQITQDQTVAQEWVRRGRISALEAETSPQRHVLLQAIGAETSDLNIEVTTIALQPGDRLLLASDGLTGMIRDDRVRSILTENNDPDEAVAALVDAANEAGGQDNISVLLVDAAGEPVPAGAGTPVVVERPVSERRRRRVPKAAYLGVVGVLVVAAAIVAFLAGQSSASYVVSSKSGHVVVLRGHVGDDDHAASGKVVRTYRDAPLDRFSDPVRRELRTGIVATSLSDARRIVDRLPRRLGPSERATPSPQPTPTTTAAQTPPKTSPAP
jgi:serine/threonine protein phosphatase PrpC